MALSALPGGDEPEGSPSSVGHWMGDRSAAFAGSKGCWSEEMLPCVLLVLGLRQELPLGPESCSGPCVLMP